MIQMLRKPMICLMAGIAFFSCNEDDDITPDLRADMDYATLNTQVAYSEQFKDASGVSTVDLTGGNTRLRMFQAMNYYSSSNTTANTPIDAAVLKKMFSNSGNPFVDISTASVSVVGSTLNSSGLQLRDAVAASKSASEIASVHTKFESEFDKIALASQSVSQTAEKGKAGKLGNYLVDAKGIEINQIIQKSLIGAFQMDYIGNVLLKEGLKADNSKVVTGKTYSQLEHNWDEASTPSQLPFRNRDSR